MANDVVLLCARRDDGVQFLPAGQNKKQEEPRDRDQRHDLMCGRGRGDCYDACVDAAFPAWDVTSFAF